MSSAKPFTCDLCSKSFADRGGRSRHRRKQHPDASEATATGKLICGKCDENETPFPSREALCLHLKDTHNIDAAVFEKEFSNSDQFDVWLAAVEDKTKSDFRCRSSDKGRKRFICFRSGTYEPKQQANRAAKSTPTIKSGFSCSAFVRAKYHDDGRVTITACTDHYGHDPITRIQHPNAGVKNRVVELVADNRKPAEVLNIIRSEAPADELHKNHLLTNF